MPARRITRPRMVCTLAAIALVAALAAGCTGGNDDEGPAADVTTTTVGEPQAGGTLVVGLEAETDGFDPTQNRWAISGLAVAKTIFEPLVAVAADGSIQPYLLESIEPNDDATVWTLRVRPGITFHDGTPLDAAVVKANLDLSMASITTTGALIFGPVESVEAIDPMTVEIRMSESWYPFPASLLGQFGYMASPAQLADRDGGPRAPVGTGPFVFESWQRDSQLTVVRNADYWRESLPYLDEITFRPLPDEGTRYNAVTTGAVDVVVTGNGAAMEDLGDDPDYTVAEYRGNEAINVIFNTAAPPFDDVRVRRALALATDREAVNAVSGGGVRADADGPIAPTSEWYAPTGYPAFDPDEARRLVAEYEAETGTDLAFTLNMPAAPQTLQFAQLLQAEWKDVGADAEIVPVDQQTLISAVVAKDFQASGWRSFEFLDPDSLYPYWRSGGVNFTQLVDPEVDAALDAGRSSPDRATRQEAYAAFGRRLGELVPAVWIGHNVWGVIAASNVHDITEWTLPDGEPGMPLFAGNFELAQIWRSR
ncbi:MAG: hypothetical protein IPM45_10940 [Acidimicrobiales bacterium]|nr:hypothetical protein [Acidimicrobiales bacterium]